jgi:transcriptional regulator with XRE-family HTH domain
MILKKDILINFGVKVRFYRKSKGLSQEELSFKADLHRTYIGMIERAEKNITLTNIEKIANALEIDIKDLFDGKKENS